jgi:hypothetical protein
MSAGNDVRNARFCDILLTGKSGSATFGKEPNVSDA